VLLASEVGERHLLTLIECGVTTIVDRATTTAAALGEALVAAAGDRAMIPSELLGRLLGLVRTMQHETLPALGLNSAGLTDREVTVLRLLADGAETAEIAQRLTYSESTIKHVLHELTIRFKFRNRVHAVASAFRAGVL
jgi:DNA-binding NarL/FixJ family response regulator